MPISPIALLRIAAKHQQDPILVGAVSIEPDAFVSKTIYGDGNRKSVRIYEVERQPRVRQRAPLLGARA
jgi:hypothetical protein